MSKLEPGPKPATPPPWEWVECLDAMVAETDGDIIFVNSGPRYGEDMHAIAHRFNNYPAALERIAELEDQLLVARINRAQDGHRECVKRYTKVLLANQPGPPEPPRGER